MLCDAHTHLLPGLDSGAATMDEATTMARALFAQNVRAAVLCPKYYPESSLTVFLRKRKEVFAGLRDCLSDDGKRVLLIPSAEVPITADIVRHPRLSSLLIPGTRYLPCTLPPGQLDDDTMRCITFLIQKRDVLPYFLHLERHILLYSASDLQRLTAIKQAVFCVSVRSLREECVKNTLMKMLFAGKTILPSTNAHNLSMRPPETRAEMLHYVGTPAERLYSLLTASGDSFFRPLLRLWQSRDAF